jgi:HK97 family phage prohead protease
MKTRETRFLRGRVEIRDATPEQTTLGYIGTLVGFVPYESDSRELRDGKGRKFVERLARGVFSVSLADNSQSVVADVGHNDAAIFARRGVNLEVSETDAGLEYTALIPDTTTGRDLQTNVRLGIIEGTSFEFELRGDGADQWEKREGATVVRTIKQAILYRVNPVSDPAYVGTKIETRSADAAIDALETPEAPSVPPTVIPLDTRLMEQRVRFL